MKIPVTEKTLKETLKKRTLYSVRYHLNGEMRSAAVGYKHQLRKYQTARRVAGRLKKSGVDAFICPCQVNGFTDKQYRLHK